ncbi:MAG: Coenzyme F420 hydrogenase/dehydrogenase, beta subunit C-terminal domain [Planctomycetaceae bacterium]|jgi:coenzyme F420-reducing hydrogenase beta subunit|nr:Coenzyme F420 hydrogenase/dehydrogenase, beta subunit C-terminal domain [Planctomycetaceae bacterium]
MKSQVDSFPSVTAHETVIEKIVQNDYCCCCGLCSACCPKQRLSVNESEYGEFYPTAATEILCSDKCRICLNVCPFSPDTADDESTLAKKRFGNNAAFSHDEALGYVHRTFVGAVADDTERRAAPSGGITTALLCRLLRENRIDAAVIARPTDNREWFHRHIATTPEEIRNSRGSVYHVLQNDGFLREILDGENRRYAVVATPCAAKAIRLAQQMFPKLAERIRFVFGLTCGGCNTLHVPDLLGVMLGNNNAGLRYRSKEQAKNALDFAVSTRRESSPRIRLLGLFGFLWINRIGRLTSCLYCNDVFAETADATFMDAWLEKYIPEPRGTNLVISRNVELTETLEAMFRDGELVGSPIAPDEVRRSQEELFQERRTQSRIFATLAAETNTNSPKCRRNLPVPSCTATEKSWGRRFLACHRATRRYLHYYSHRLARSPNFYSRFYVGRLYWKIFFALFRYRLLGKTFRSLHFMKKGNTK